MRPASCLLLFRDHSAEFDAPTHMNARIRLEPFANRAHLGLTSNPGQAEEEDGSASAGVLTSTQQRRPRCLVP